ncbi:MAG: hypothetical protein KH828_07745 [Clostridiales bacterium]|nr:hypothetical protein [Clostridiales bacterium]
MEPVKVKIDHEKLIEALREQQKTQIQLSNELGMSDQYLATRHKRGDEYPVSMEMAICHLLGKEKGYFIREEKVETDQEARNPKILENIYRENRRQMELLENIGEKLEDLFRKVNANTVQLEKIKESVGQMAKTDLDIAVEFLRKMLSGGRVDGGSILMEAENAGIKRSDLMKAKKELNVQVEVSYGKNQKNWWYMKY